MYNIKLFYKARNEAIKFYDDYSSMMPEAKGRATKTTPKQMLQRLLIALALLLLIIQKFYQMKSGKLSILCINQNKSLKKYTII